MEHQDYNGGNDSLIDTKELKLNRFENIPENLTNHQIRKTFAADINQLLMSQREMTMRSFNNESKFS